MSAPAGLRERKKAQTRQAIFEAARALFDERGFDAVTVAEVARAADVSEVTVFNYFPSKEDLFYGGMHRFEEELLDAVRSRARGVSPARALRRRLLQSTAGLLEPERIQAIVKSAATVGASPSLAAREREIVARYTDELSELLGEADDVEARTAAAALMGAHRAVVEHVRARVLAGLRGPALVEETRAQIRRAYRLVERGLAAYGERG